MTVSNTSSSTSTTTNTSTVTGGTSIANNFDQFLTLLTTQLKNQSPLDPLDTNQFTAQLVQFAGVEQQLKTNETLTSLLSLNSANTAINAVNFVGTEIEATGATTQLADNKAEWKIDMPRTGTAIIAIKDANGSTVQTVTKTLDSGSQAFTWDGTTSTGSKAADGQYTISIEARDSSGAVVTPTTTISGMVDGVDFSGGAVVLKIGDLSVPVEQIKSVVRK
ncbi:MAG TPA: flagellar hook capping FlgD N-terminal domain-containing protein [Bosea sp. (in: a-proteobacteria)]|jgi:flagellar basal-body rod modification protein FlgD|uniref:flagellar hook assembly protein FlgD n=1 Tax=Bosea sp. (in: a-proteobacteria) TaxID=1871050 RepID=UPI002E155B61|nr:flagellar hook capping FlgD N-terminal domain-containing protein [Bosea sp. (in: a-proteobacteria)]